MFYYYGAKNLLSRYYPFPAHDVIVEPFAGSAAYSCYHLSRSPDLTAILFDKDDAVAEAWDFLLTCSERDMKEYPKPKVGEYTTDFLHMTCAVSNASSKCRKMRYTQRIDRVFEIQRRRILSLLPLRDRIRFEHLDYSESEQHCPATYFVDPPYQVKEENRSIFQNGRGYSKQCSSGTLNYEELSEFCRRCSGQVIVCEKEGASWLPFLPFRTNKTSLNRRYREVIWTNSA